LVTRARKKNEKKAFRVGAQMKATAKKGEIGAGEEPSQLEEGPRNQTNVSVQRYFSGYKACAAKKKDGGEQKKKKKTFNKGGKLQKKRSKKSFHAQKTFSRHATTYTKQKGMGTKANAFDSLFGKKGNLLGRG